MGERSSCSLDWAVICGHPTPWDRADCVESDLYSCSVQPPARGLRSTEARHEAGRGQDVYRWLLPSPQSTKTKLQPRKHLYSAPCAASCCLPAGQGEAKFPSSFFLLGMKGTVCLLCDGLGITVAPVSAEQCSRMDLRNTTKWNLWVCMGPFS